MAKQPSNSIVEIDLIITEQWDNGYKLEIDLTAETDALFWQIDFQLPRNNWIREAYGVDLTENDDGSYSIRGENDQINLREGQSIKPTFIVDGMTTQDALLKFIGSDLNTIVETESLDTEELESDSTDMGESEATEEMPGKFVTSSSIVEDWDGGYKLELDLTDESEAEDWELDFKLPYEIRNAYGVELQDNGNGNYTISGKNDQTNLQQGQTIKPIFIIEDNGQEALPLEFGISITVDGSQSEDSQSETESDSDLESNSDAITVGDSQLEDSQPESESDFSSESNSDANFNTRVASEFPATPTVQKGKFAYGEALQLNFLFYEANRSGDLPPENRLEWRSDSTLNDGSDNGVDLEGGYFDAGDHIKFIQPMAFSNTMLAWGGIDYQEAYKKSGQFDELLDAVKWGTDWFLKAHEMDSNGNTSRLWVQVGDKTDHYEWVPPEEIDQVTDRKSYYIDAERPGSDAAAGTASALASASMLFRGTDDAYADELLKNAIALYEFAETYQAKYSDSVPEVSPFYTSWSGYWDELSLGAAWLYKATGEQQYLAKSENYFRDKIGSLGDWTYATDDHSYGAAMLLAEHSSDSFFKNQVKNWLNTWEQGKGGINDTPAGFAHRTAWASIPVDMSTSFAAEWYNDHIEADDSFSFFAMDRVNYVLGDNPRDYSYMVGFGDDFPIRTHHRGSAGSVPLNDSDQANDRVLHGAIVGGLEEANDYSYYDRRDDWITNEVGVSYNAPFASAVIQQYENLGGDVLSQAELDQLVGVDANGVGI